MTSRLQCNRLITAVVAGLTLVTLIGCAHFTTDTKEADAEKRDDLQLAYLKFQQGAYDDVIDLIARYRKHTPEDSDYEPQWLLAQTYEQKGDTTAAIEEYKSIRKNFPQTAHGSEALYRIELLERQLPSRPADSSPSVSSRKEYRLDADDEVQISVYGDDELSNTQTVRPDGKIAFPLAGDVYVAGMTPDELRAQITLRLSKFVRNPQVTVIVSKYNSKQVYVLGQVKTPGIVRLSTDITVLQGIAHAGGMTDDADLQGALLVRNAQIVPVNFERLLRNGDFTQNIPLHPNDTILVPNVSGRKIFILGEVKQPIAIPLKQAMSLVESLSIAGGFTRDADSKNVVIVRGGLGSSNMFTVNVDQITDKAVTAKNAVLQPNDIVYVPKTLMAHVDRFFEHVSKIIAPIVLTEFGIALGPTVYSVLTKGKVNSQVPIIVQPNALVAP